LAEHKNTYLDFFDEPLGSALYSGRLLGLGELLVTDEVVPALAPHKNVLATILGAPLDLMRTSTPAIHILHSPEIHILHPLRHNL
jgi:hypothetical protein